MRLAAAMLRRGDDPDTVSATTEVPVALLELLAEEIATETDTAPSRAQRRRQTIAIAAVIEVVAFGNAIASVAALDNGSTRLGVVTGVIAGALTVAVWLLARGAARR